MHNGLMPGYICVSLRRLHINSYPEPLFFLPTAIPLWPVELSLVFMSETFSTSNTQSLIADALVEYTKITGIDLSTNPFTTALEQSSSPEDILQLLQGRENAFREYRDGNRTLMSSLKPAVRVLQGLSGILGEGGMVSDTSHLENCLNGSRQLPFPPANALFAGIDVLMSVRPLNMPFKQLPFDVSV